jgi:DnaJ-class molecular chaperone
MSNDFDGVCTVCFDAGVTRDQDLPCRDCDGNGTLVAQRNKTNESTRAKFFHHVHRLSEKKEAMSPEGDWVAHCHVPFLDIWERADEFLDWADRDGWRLIACTSAEYVFRFSLRA